MPARKHRSTDPLPRIAVTRREAAQMLGVSIDVIAREKAAGRLRAKTTKVDADGRPRGRELYSPAELQRWFDSLDDT